MFNPPKQEPTESTEFKDWKDFKFEDKSSEFEYNPAAQEITNQNKAFPEVTDYLPPEKE